MDHLAACLPLLAPVPLSVTRPLGHACHSSSRGAIGARFASNACLSCLHAMLGWAPRLMKGWAGHLA